ncbi:WhiB family transcriptional regulator [Streptomyces sp. NPDC091376]|uniref:WhiB family transcriptional regulator n=1 Tax=Streptomyces sp. NPDC091376 TaxID=3365994 RepID=UPI0038161C42
MRPTVVTQLASRFPELLRNQDSPLPCTVDPNLFDPDAGGPASLARSLCYQCPLVQACAAYACHHHRRGIWGGTTERERRLAGYPPRPCHPAGPDSKGEN